LLGVEDVNCRMSRCWTRELIGGMVETCIGNMTCKGLRCCRSYCMAMLNLKLLMLSYRLNLVQIHFLKNFRCMSYVQKPPTHWVWLFEPKLSERIVIWPIQIC
jgi:hypothetical protein